MVDEQSLQNAVGKWLAEVKSYSRAITTIFIGTKADLHREYALDGRNSHKLVSTSTISRLLKNEKCFCCSALTQKGLNEVFTWAIGAEMTPVKETGNECQMI